MPFLRRTFLTMAGGIWALREARAMVRSGELGRVVFCRASRHTVGWLPLLLDAAPPVCEETEREELVLCGTEATLVIDRTGYRRFA
jgi:hypothetical protein